LQELESIKKIAKKYRLPIHMDGARFAGSLAHLGCTPAELTWKSGIDVMSFGATKNGALTGEAVVFFNPKYTQDFDYRQKRAGQLMSKMRFFSCQFLAYFKDDLWLHNASHANDMAQELADIFVSQGFKLKHPVQSNEVFVCLPEKIAKNLQDNGSSFYEWGVPGSNLYRFVTSCFTQNSDLEVLKKHLRAL
jgi:threonine aldolase